MKMSKFVPIFLAALVLLPIAAYGQTGAGTSPPVSQPDQMGVKGPPVEQSLVPEGVFAVQLAEALKLGQVQDEAQAESMLSAVGIEPKNGWIAGYPVTPPVVSEIERGVVAAAEAGKLGMGKAEAIDATKNLEARVGLSISAGAGLPSTAQPASSRMVNTTIYKYVDRNGVTTYTDQYESIPREYRDQVQNQGRAFQREIQYQSSVEQPGPEVIEMLGDGYGGNPAAEPGNYYYPENANPEVVNNYYYDNGPPVVTYYPPPSPYNYLYAWVPYPFWCSGFYFPGFFILHDFHRHVFFGGHSCVVTNHVTGGGGHRVSVVDPASRTLRGSTLTAGVPRSQGFRSPGGRSGAQAIVAQNQNRPVSRGASTPTRVNHVSSSNSFNRSPGPIRTSQGLGNGQRVTRSVSRPGPLPHASAGRTFSPPSVQGRSINASFGRGSATPSISSGRVFSGFASSSRGSFGEGRAGSSGSGHSSSFGGGSRGHR